MSCYIQCDLCQGYFVHKIDLSLIRYRWKLIRLLNGPNCGKHDDYDFGDVLIRSYYRCELDTGKDVINWRLVLFFTPVGG